MTNKASAVELLEEQKYTISPDIMKAFVCEMQVYRAAIKEMRTKLENLDDSFQARYEYNPIHHIETRLKSIPSILKKLEARNIPMSIENMNNELSDIAGVRVICNYFDDVEQVADMLLSQDDVTLIRRKDYHRHPSETGYRSLHLVVSIPVFLAGERRDVAVEIQIRTIAMDLWASLEHQLRYKNRHNTPIPEELSERLYTCALALAEVDKEMQMIYDAILKLNN